MKYQLLNRLGAFFALFVIINWPLNSAASTTFSVDPSSKAVNVGDIFSLNVSISDVTDLFSYQFDIAFDPLLLTAKDITETAFLSTGGSTSFVPGFIDNDAGTISFTANTLLGATPGVTGNGILASVNFQALASGISPVEFSNIVLLDSSLGEISATATGSTIEVTAVPLPGSLFFFLSGFAILYQRCIRVLTNRSPVVRNKPVRAQARAGV